MDFLNIDLHFARFICELAGAENDPMLHLAAACASHALQNGHVCADLAIFPELFPSDGPLNEHLPGYPNPSTWSEHLKKTSVVGTDDDYRPLILDGSRLYLHRYWHYEQDLAEAIREKCKETTAPDAGRIITSLSDLFSPGIGAIAGERQQLAAITSAIKNLIIISGGPGTGKTSTVIRMLSLLIDQLQGLPCLVALAAPTGKAAARLNQALQDADSMGRRISLLKNLVVQTPSTIHRLLGVLPNSPYFKHNADNPLPYDILVVDEASMIDLALMAKLFSALKPGSKLIVLGDKDQLASVEAGAIMGDMCDTYAEHKKTPEFCAEISKISQNHGLFSDVNEPALSDCIGELKKNYRFAENSGIGIISDAIKRGNSSEAWRILDSNVYSDMALHVTPGPENLPQKLYRKIVERYAEYLGEKDPSRALTFFDRFRVLCTVRKGPYGVESMNSVIERLLQAAGLIRLGAPWYPGRPIMVLSNDYNLNLFNGDVGILLPDPAAQSDVRAFFPGDAPGSVRSLLPQRLPAVETIFAMTVHKAQGSQFDHVLLMLPQTFSPILSRELIYTGITRAHKSCDIWCNKEVFTKAVERKISRMSGLKDKLWGER